MSQIPTSAEYFSRAQSVLPGGVNSPVRAFGSVGTNPVWIDSAEGARLYSNEGKEYIDYVGSWGPMILGHNHPVVREAVIKATEKGTSFGTVTLAEMEWAELVCNTVDSVEMVRMVNSGTEATMSVVRLARGATGRDLMIKFRGCYHGHGDSFLIEAGSGALTFGQPSSPGVTKGTAEGTLLADYNDLSSVESLFEIHSDKIACVIVEPIAGNMGVVAPKEGFLRGLRDLCDKHGSLLILDEVMTGFRVHLQGAQGLYGVKPDLTTFGKIVGGGLPVGAYGGRKELMEQLSPVGLVYQAGTLSGNPLATAAGLATLKELLREGFYEDLEEQAKIWEAGIREVLENLGVKHAINRVGSMMTVFFGQEKVENYADATACDTERFAAWFRGLLDRGVYVAPSQFEAGFLSEAHTLEDLEKTKGIAEEVLKTM